MSQSHRHSHELVPDEIPLDQMTLVSGSLEIDTSGVPVSDPTQGITVINNSGSPVPVNGAGSISIQLPPGGSGSVTSGGAPGSVSITTWGTFDFVVIIPEAPPGHTIEHRRGRKMISSVALPSADDDAVPAGSPRPSVSLNSSGQLG